MYSRAAADRDRGLDRVFGDVLPGSTSDDRPSRDEADPGEHERWLRDNRPPHHDTAW